MNKYVYQVVDIFDRELTFDLQLRFEPHRPQPEHRDVRGGALPRDLSSPREFL